MHSTLIVCRCGFTLIELLVVIAILICLLLPVVRKAAATPPASDAGTTFRGIAAPEKSSLTTAPLAGTGTDIAVSISEGGLRQRGPA